LTEDQDASLLQRRARRRVVGAIALVVLIVIALPIVLDKEPSPIGQDLVIQIPSQEAGKFNTRVLPKSAPAAAPEKAVVPGTAPALPAAPPAQDKAAPASDARQDAAALARDRAAKDESDAARAKALLEGKETWVIRLGAFSNEDNVRQLRSKLTAAGIKSYTETVKGPKGMQTRVRAGPFESKGEAEKAQKELTVAGVSPGTVGPR